VRALRIDDARVHAFPMEGRPMDEWESPFDAGEAKVDVGLGALDRMLLFVGPLEWGAGPDLIVEALPTVLSRTSNVRVVFVGCGNLHGSMADRAHRMGVGHSVRMLGHVELPRLIPLLRGSEALLMPARQRMGQDQGVVGLARRAGIPVLTTHSGPGHLVRHEQDGLLVYDNPPSLVWGMSRLLEDRRHAEDMGQSGLQQGDGASWSGVARAYADLCARNFAELRETAEPGRSPKERGLS
jgi:glycogen(starch) synthase